MDVLEKKLSDMAEVASEVKGSKVVGIHLEGPFINKEYQGAQNPLYIQGANIKVFDLFNKAAKNLIKVVSYAPERTTIDFTTHCASKGIVTSVAHSNATFSDVEAHYNVGLKSLTHFHNAQSGHHHRKPGVVTAGFCFDLNAELICDGLHLDKDVVRTTFKIKGREHITLISDSTKAANMPDGYYDLGGLSVIKDSSSARLEDGSLAGSILNYNDGVRNFHQFTNCSLIDLVHVSSYNQAKLLGETELGDIKEGYKADLVIMNDDFEVMQTIIDGKVVLDNLK
jgi:N-acetylglucosamine-6-phosphate deacetylase